MNATPTVSHEDGVQNGPLVSALATRLPNGIGTLAFSVFAVLAFLFWAYTLVVTWISRGDLSTPLFQTTVAFVVVTAVAFFARKTLAWLVPAVIGAAWLVLSILPLLPLVQVAVQAVIVTLFVAATVVALVSAEKAEKPRF